MKRSKKIIFCLDGKFTNRDYQRFGCAYLEECRYSVEVWNIGTEKYKLVAIPQGYYQGLNALDVNVQEAIAKTKIYSSSIFVILSDGLENLLFQNRKTKHYIMKYLSAGSLGYSLMEIPKMYSGKSQNNVWQLVLMEYKAKIKKRCADKFSGNMVDYYILSTHQCLSIPQNVEKEKIRYVHTGDYDRYLEYKRRGVFIGEELILYIDSGFGLVDIDGVRRGNKDPWREKSEIHCNERNRIFDRLEKYYGLPVIIAGHPHTDYSSADFGRREIVFDRTCELTARAKFVILQWSTAASYAMLFEKPIMILLSDNLIQHVLYHELVYANYKLLNLKVCNMDVEECEKAPWKYVNVIDEDMRKKYIHAFIKEGGTPEILSYEMLEKIIRVIEDENHVSVRRHHGRMLCRKNGPI